MVRQIGLAALAGTGLWLCLQAATQAQVDSAPADYSVMAGPAETRLNRADGHTDFGADGQSTPLGVPPAMGAGQERVPRFDGRGAFTLTLEEALFLSMQHSDVVLALDGRNVNIESATSYDPAVADQHRKAALAAFDTAYSAGFYWNRFDSPPDSFFGPGIPRDERRDEGTFLTGLTKRWTTGAETRISYNPSPGYLYFPNGASGLNPNHVTALELAIRQPLLRGAGRDVNLAPATIAQLRTDQSGWEFKRALLAFVRSVEEAYWNLQAARSARQAIQEQIPLIDEVVRIAQANQAAQRTVAGDVAKARAEQHALRLRLAEVALAVQEAELQLLQLMGIGTDGGGPHPVPVTPASRAPVQFDPDSLVASALENRPDIIRQLISMRIRQVELRVAQNRFLPQLDVQTLYRANGLEERLDDSLEMMAGQEYHDWEFAAVFTVPLCRRADRANLCAAELQLQKARAMLREQLNSTVYELSTIANRIDSFYAQYRDAEARRAETMTWLIGARIRYQNPPPAGGQESWLLVALDDYLLAMRAAADAVIDESALLAAYNTEMARLEETRGTLLSSRNLDVPMEAPGGR